jgi:hypothetical protein
VDDSSEHREGSDCDGRAHEQRGIESCGVSGKQSRYGHEPWRAHQRNQEWRGHAGNRNGGGFAEVVLEVIGAEAEPHQEHVQAHAQLSAHIEDALGLRGEDDFLDLRQEQAEQRRPEDHAGNHLAHHLWLLEITAAQPTDQATGGQDDEHLQEKSYR